MKFRITLENSDNGYLSYPCVGRIQIIETFLDGNVRAVFQPGVFEGAEFKPAGGPVEIQRPTFRYEHA